MLTNADLAELADWRRALHRAPELSGQEHATAAAFAAEVARFRPDEVVTGLGTTGVAAVWQGREPGPTVMIRAELDALPIVETGSAPWASDVPGIAHLCGHDGHLTILAGVARLLSRRPPASGRVILLGQPAEETGAGAAAVLADPAFAALSPDWAFALHNMPGMPLGHVALRAGPMNCASVGLRIALLGRTSHAAEPSAAHSPALAVARLIPGLIGLGHDGPLDDAFRLVTLTHARLGEPAFGITPGEAEVWATLRTLTDAGMTGLRDEAAALVADLAGGFSPVLTWHDDFAACANHPEATACLASAVRTLGLPLSEGDLPMRASEDFGRFGAVARSAMLCLGAGEAVARLHAPDYDFPDALIAPGARIFDRTIRDLLG
ncbi:MAG TPA: amidohydrolase [Paracoccaceae bacterium]|nr:amidohydrolase [Paracoccaceae bacterium]HMO70720.1 amidohydrolase [Paracoccaceae bacterium]